ncbi:MAG: pentapeptide repeat-containing protein [Polyangiaceae bacterium]|nr:pentapeptide repeat-containing protein [Polyangiaceae bacterium]
MHRREVDAAFCAASVLASLDALAGAARELYEDYAPRRLPLRVPGRSLEADGWALLRHPLENPAVGDALAPLLPRLDLEPATDGAIDMVTLAWAAELLGAPASDLPKDGAPPLGDREDLDQVWQNRTLRERLFFAGRAATALRFPAHRLDQVSDRPLPKELGVTVTQEIQLWRVGMMLTRARAGMLACGEPLVARQILVREKQNEVTIGHLTLFAVSPAHHRLRAKLGIAIGMGADAPAGAPAPVPTAPATVAMVATPATTATPATVAMVATPATTATPATPATTGAPASETPFAPSAPARTIREMQFVAALQPCGYCGKCDREPASFEPAEGRWRGRGTCRHCGATRVFEFTAQGDPRTRYQGRSNLGGSTSAILTPEDLLRAYDKAVARTADAPPAAHADPGSDAVVREIWDAITCLMEIFKFLVQDKTRPVSGPRPSQSWVLDEYTRLKTFLQRHAARTVSDVAMAAHRAWLERGARGDGQIVLRRERLRNEWYEGVEWSFASIIQSDLTNVTLSQVNLRHAHFEEVVFSDANLDGSILAQASIRRCALTNTSLRDVALDEAEVEGTRFTASDMADCSFRGARVDRSVFDGVIFGSTVFDGAEFRDCTFRDATFAKFSKPQTSVDASFINCDFTGTDWTGHDLSGTTFINCTFAGAHGKPAATNRLILVTCDVDAVALVAQLSGGAPAAVPAAPAAVPAAPAAPASLRLSAKSIVHALVEPETPPRTVGALLDALGLALEDSVVAAGSNGTIILAPRMVDWIAKQRLAIRYALEPSLGSASVAPTVAWLRERRVVAFSLVCPEKSAIDVALAARFGRGPRREGAQGDEYWIFGQWVHTLRSGVLGWFERMPDWLSAPADAQARSAALRALHQALAKTAALGDLATIVARLPPSGGLVRSEGAGGDALELTFVPPIPANMLSRALFLQTVVAVLGTDGWVLRGLPNGNETGVTKPFQLGSWHLVPRLADEPTAGFGSDPRLRCCSALDVVVSMRIQSA